MLRVELATGSRVLWKTLTPSDPVGVEAMTEYWLMPLVGFLPADDPEATRPAFRRTAELAARSGLAGLSMGMTADFEVAVEEGATLIRIGTALFGPRPTRRPARAAGPRREARWIEIHDGAGRLVHGRTSAQHRPRRTTFTPASSPSQRYRGCERCGGSGRGRHQEIRTIPNGAICKLPRIRETRLPR